MNLRVPPLTTVDVGVDVGVCVAVWVGGCVAVWVGVCVAVWVGVCVGDKVGEVVGVGVALPQAGNRIMIIKKITRGISNLFIILPPLYLFK
jgi:hypothetical protein